MKSSTNPDYLGVPKPKPDINQMAMDSIIEERGSAFTTNETYRRMRRHYDIVEVANARTKARELLEMVGAYPTKKKRSSITNTNTNTKGTRT